MSLSSNFPIIKPSLNLDFANVGTLDPRITFTRASTATYYNQLGVLTSAAVDVPRFDYNPSTLAPLGLLIEEQRTNSELYSEDFANAHWQKNQATVTSNVIIAPDGNLTGDKLITDSGLGNGQVFATVALTASTTFTFSCFAKAGEWSWSSLGTRGPENIDIGAWFNLSAGTVGTVSAGVTASITPVGNGWYRCAITRTTGTGATASRQRIYSTNADNTLSTGDGTSGIYIWGAQLEAGAFPTSYIPTTTTALTRSADVASMTGTNFSSWFNAVEGTVFVSAQFTESVALKTIYEINDNTTTNHIRATVNASVTTPIFQVSNVTAQAAITLGSAALNVFLMTNAYKVDDFSAALGGTLGTPDTSGSLPTVTQLTIGRRITDRYLNGYIRRIAYYPVRLANTTLQALTG
jgi:hypothetical protein